MPCSFSHFLLDVSFQGILKHEANVQPLEITYDECVFKLQTLYSWVYIFIFLLLAQELKKHTRPTHKDFQTVKQALETMKNVASLINERKRKVESINKIAKWQSTIEGWEVSEDRPQGDWKGKVSKGEVKEKDVATFDRGTI